MQKKGREKDKKQIIGGRYAVNSARIFEGKQNIFSYSKRDMKYMKQQHTIKSQVVADKFTKKIICTSFASVKCHDFNLLKKSKLPIFSST